MMHLRDVRSPDFFSPLDESERRQRLRRLDDLLTALEDLNLREQGDLPQRLKDRMIAEGIPVRNAATVTDLIDVVLASQEQYMLKERRTGRRRRRLSFIPTDDDLVAVISSRFSH
ncbi:MAG TPA: hypothetical protein VG245_10565 [Candidatus Dormibacteraeota bacterium]|jgi:hypothetical protein|nr:hypothetical protein [Candidatus Dormibacteraeota bacterium]